MKNLLSFLLATILLAACDFNGAQEPVEKMRDGIFIHITHDHSDPHRVLMPLSMAVMMANDKDVLIYLDIEAVNLVTKDAEDIEYAHFASLKASLEKLIDMNVGIYACPGCMKAAGISPDDLIEGIQVAQKDKFFDFTQGRILSLNY